MPTDLSSTLLVVGRLLLGGMFVIFAIRNIRNIPRLSGILEGRRLPQPRPIVMVGIALQFVGGLLSAIGPWPLAGGVLMIVFLVLATVLFHPMWEFTGEARYPHTTATLMNSSLVGAFLLLIAATL